MMARLANLIARSRMRAIVVVGVWLVLAAVVPRLAPAVDEVKQDGGNNAAVPGTQSAAARDLLLEKFPDQRGVPAIIVVRNPAGLSAQDRDEVARISAALAGPDAPAGVHGVVSVSTMPQAESSLVSADGTTTTILVPITGLASTDERFTASVARIREIAGTGTGGTEIRVTGPAGIAADATEVFRNADVLLLFATVLLVVVLLLVIYRSPLLMLIPLVAVGVAMQLASAIGATLARAGVIVIDSQTASIMTVLLFGAGTDYALFVLMRFREELSVTDDRYAAMRAALRRVGDAVLSSATTVVLALLTLLLATVPTTRQFGPYLAIAVACIVLVSLTFVPAAVLLCGRAAFWPMRQAGRDPGERSLWGRVAGLVQRRSGTVVATSLLVLGGLALGLLSYAPNANLISDLRGQTDSLRGQQLLAAAFPPGELAPTAIVVLAAEPGPAAAEVASAVEGVAGVKTVSAPVVAADGTAARLSVVYADDPYGTPALRRTEQVRAVAAAALPAGTVLVGGESANALDNRTGSQRDLWVVAAAMAVLILAVLALVLRALAAPLILLATTALSLLSALGATVLTFVVAAGQAGTNDRVLLYSLIFLVALGVDYNILLASRIREEVAVHGFVDGIRIALTRTGGVITSAGVILAGTFAVLMTQPLNSLTQFGFAMAVGILLDTFVIRGMLVPALLLRLGPRVWWPGRSSRQADLAPPGRSSRQADLASPGR